MRTKSLVQLVDKVEPAGVKTDGHEHANDCGGQGPFIKITLIVPDLQTAGSLIVLRKDAGSKIEEQLHCQDCQQDIFEVNVGLTESFAYLLDFYDDDRVVDLCEKSNNEEGCGAYVVEQFEHMSGIDAGRAHHQQQSTHYACFQRYFRVVGFEVDPVLDTDSFEDEVIGHPAENDETSSGYSAYPEYDELWVVLSHSADGVAGEGRVVFEVLGNPVDGDETEDCADASHFVEEKT